MENTSDWKTLKCFVEIRSPWLTLIGEKLQNEQQRVLEYWRVEKADSAIVVTIQKNCFLLPIPTYRPGLKTTTLDFPGGRVSGKHPATTVPGILQRELGVTASDLICLNPLNPLGWAINSSFSNQKLYSFVAEVSPTADINPARLGASYPTTPAGVRELLRVLTCLQCRAVLLEWCRTQS